MLFRSNGDPVIRVGLWLQVFAETGVALSGAASSDIQLWLLVKLVCLEQLLLQNGCACIVVFLWFYLAYFCSDFGDRNNSMNVVGFLYLCSSLLC